MDDSLGDRLKADMISAMKAKEKERLAVLRMLIAKLKDAAITAGLRVQIGRTPEPTLIVFVRARKALMRTMASRASRLSPCQISLKPRSSI